VDKFRTDHPKGDCGKQWDKVSHLFTGGRIVYVAPKAKEVKPELLELEEQLKQLQEEAEDTNRTFDRIQAERDAWREFQEKIQTLLDEQCIKARGSNNQMLLDVLEPLLELADQGIGEKDARF
jgi:TolA-binding protein